MIKKLIGAVALMLTCTATFAAEGGYPLDKAPYRVNDMASLQNGAKLFVNYCLNCHSASSMRYNKLKDIGLTDQQIKESLLFTGEKVGDMMNVAMNPKDAKQWFGTTPPDLSLIARAKSVNAGPSGADYIYTYLRTFYRDTSRATGWNNLVFPAVGMPHALWELQGQRVAKYVEAKDPHDPSKTVHRFAGFEQVTPGKLSPQAYDSAVADLVAYLQWMGEPAQNQRVRVGVWVLLFLAAFFVIAWRLNAAYWKDVK